MIPDVTSLMTGPEHFREAERLTALAMDDATKLPMPIDWLLAAALVHATLANTAATALSAVASLRMSGGAWPYCEDDSTEWHQVVGRGGNSRPRGRENDGTA